jgi:hypothetical protein
MGTLESGVVTGAIDISSTIRKFEQDSPRAWGDWRLGFGGCLYGGIPYRADRTEEYAVARLGTISTYGGDCFGDFALWIEKSD